MSYETSTSRADHLQWAKSRALEFIARGEIVEGLTSLASDLQKHPGTERHAAVRLGMRLYISGNMKTPEDARTFIEGIS